MLLIDFCFGLLVMERRDRLRLKLLILKSHAEQSLSYHRTDISIPHFIKKKINANKLQAVYIQGNLNCIEAAKEGDLLQNFILNIDPWQTVRTPYLLQ